MIETIGAGIALLGLLFVGLYLRSRGRAAASQGWPETPGRVTSATMNLIEDEESGDVYSPYVSYEYQVGGRSLSGSRIRFGSASSRDQAKAAAVLQRYPEGKAVTVYYDPARPDEAVLERSAAGSASYLYLGVGFLLFGILAPFLF